MKKLVVLFAIASIVIFYSCKEGITDPIEPEAGRRDYALNVDTLNNIEIGKLWGLMPNDIWAIKAYYFQNELWHFDGSTWNYSKIFYYTPIRTFVGTSPTNIWLTTHNENSVWLYNGVESEFKFHLEYQDFQQVEINDMNANAPWNVYGVGTAVKYSPQSSTNGVILHYDGLKWSYLDIPPIEAVFTNVYTDGKNGVIIKGHHRGAWEETLWYYENNTLKEIVSSNDYCKIAIINNGVLVSSKKKVYKLDKGSLIEIIDFKELQNDIEGIWGRTTSDFFVMVKEGIAHYNGSDLKIICPLDNTIIEDAIIFDNEVVFAAYSETNKNTYIIRGKLKE
ncbi:MAG: hypothetical protein WC055_15145 [Melioribacteraceae bacterium]